MEASGSIRYPLLALLVGALCLLLLAGGQAAAQLSGPQGPQRVVPGVTFVQSPGSYGPVPSAPPPQAAPAAQPPGYLTPSPMAPAQQPSPEQRPVLPQPPGSLIPYPPSRQPSLRQGPMLLQPQAPGQAGGLPAPLPRPPLTTPQGMQAPRLPGLAAPEEPQPPQPPLAGDGQFRRALPMEPTPGGRPGVPGLTGRPDQGFQPGMERQSPAGELPPSTDARPDLPPGTFPPAQLPSGAEGPAVAQPEPLSSIEASFMGPVEQRLPAPLRQFGYDLFRQASGGGASPGDLPVGPDYVLGPGDGLLVRSWGSFFFDYNITVARNGQIFLPEIGPLNLAGLSLAEAERIIQQAVTAKYHDIQLSITLGQLRSITVVVIGEVARPGSYQLSSLSTLLHALFAAGGPTKQGSLRRIQLSRGTQVLAEADLYRLLLQGDQSQDYRLQSGDTLFVPLIGKVAGIGGNVRRPALYELKGEMALQGLLEMAGGITPFGYTQTIQVERALAHERKVVLDLNLKEVLIAGNPGAANPAGALILQDADLVQISPIAVRVQNQVELIGNVERPGRYEFKPGIRVSDVLRLGKQLLPETYMDRAEIERFVPPDNHLEIVPFNLAALLQGDLTQDVPLREQDRVLIYSIYDFKDRASVKVEGAVRRPGLYPLLKDMTVRDLLYRAGGLQEEAFKERALLTRMNSRRISPEGTISPHFQWINLGKVLTGEEGENLRLEDTDTLTIYSVYYYGRKPLVSVEGMVRKPGEYELLEGMKLSDLLNQAGGLQKEAFRERALLSRVNSRTLSPQATVVPKFYWVYLDKLLQGDDREDVPLQELDKLTVYSVFYYGQRPRVKIKGMVRNPREYELFEQMRASDLVNLAGGVTDQAFLSKVLLTRVSTSRGSAASGAGQAEFIWINLGRVLKGDHAHDVRLQHLDELTVYPTWFFSQLLGPQGVREVRAADEGKDTTTAQRARAPSGPEKKAKASERTGRGAGRP